MARFRRVGATLSLANRGNVDSDHKLHGILSDSPERQRRKFVPIAQKLQNKLSNAYPSLRTPGITFYHEQCKVNNRISRKLMIRLNRLNGLILQSSLRMLFTYHVDSK